MVKSLFLGKKKDRNVNKALNYCDLSQNQFRDVINKYKHLSKTWKKNSRGICKLVKQLT